MTGISSVSGGSQLPNLASLRQSAFNKIDTDGNGTVSKDEFVSARPKGVSETDAASLYAKIDSQGTNAVTQDQLESGFQQNGPGGGKGAGLGGQLSSDLVALLLQLKDDKQGTSATTRGTSGQQNSADLFAQLDTDGNGAVSKSEFVAGRPDGVSESDATALFNKIDSDSKGSITSDQFAAAAPPQGLPPFAEFGGSGAQSDNSTGSSSQDLVQKLLAAINSYQSSSGYSVNFDPTSSLLASA